NEIVPELDRSDIQGVGVLSSPASILVRERGWNCLFYIRRNSGPRNFFSKCCLKTTTTVNVKRSRIHKKHATEIVDAFRQFHSMTRSIRKAISGGGRMPSAAAVFAFIVDRNRLATSNGMSAGRWPLSTLTITAAIRRWSSLPSF